MFVSIPVGASMDSSKQNSLGQEVVKDAKVDYVVTEIGASILVAVKVPATGGGVVIIVVVETGPTEAWR